MHSQVKVKNNICIMYMIKLHNLLVGYRCYLMRRHTRVRGEKISAPSAFSKID